MTIMRQIHSTSAVLQAQHPNNTPSASNRLFKSPRPTPKFLPEENTFSQKKVSCYNVNEPTHQEPTHQHFNEPKHAKQ